MLKNIIYLLVRTRVKVGSDLGEEYLWGILVFHQRMRSYVLLKYYHRQLL